MVAYHLAARPDSRLFHGRLFFLGGTANLEQPAPGVHQGDLSGIAALELSPLLRPYTFPPLELALESNWDTKLALLAEQSIRERITLVSGVPSWLLMLFQRVLELTGESSHRRGLAPPRARRPRGCQVRPLPEVFPWRSWDGRKSDSRKLTPVPKASSPLATRERNSCACFSITASSMNSYRSTSWTRPTPRGTGWALSSGASTTRSSSRRARGCGRTSSATRSGSSRSTRPCSPSPAAPSTRSQRSASI